MWKTLAILGLLLAGVLGILAVPQPLFAHKHVYRNFEVWSDRPIDGAATDAVLDDATRRLERSEIYDETVPVRLFVCNEAWRMRIYSQRGSSRLAGVADTWLTQNVYLREADFSANRLVSPSGGAVADEGVRPLSYFIAHEVTHILVARRYGRLAALRYPHWLLEGYADYVGKGETFDFAENLALLKAGDVRLDPANSGLYRRYHLMTAWLLDKQKKPLDAIFDAPPSEAEMLAVLRATARASTVLRRRRPRRRLCPWLRSARRCRGRSRQ